MIAQPNPAATKALAAWRRLKPTGALVGTHATSAPNVTWRAPGRGPCYRHHLQYYTRGEVTTRGTTDPPWCLADPAGLELHPPVVVQVWATPDGRSRMRLVCDLLDEAPPRPGLPWSSPLLSARRVRYGATTDPDDIHVRGGRVTRCDWAWVVEVCWRTCRCRHA